MVNLVEIAELTHDNGSELLPGTNMGDDVTVTVSGNIPGLVSDPTQAGPNGTGARIGSGPAVGEEITYTLSRPVGAVRVDIGGWDDLDGAQDERYAIEINGTRLNQAQLQAILDFGVGGRNAGAGIFADTANGSGRLARALNTGTGRENEFTIAVSTLDDGTASSLWPGLASTGITSVTVVSLTTDTTTFGQGIIGFAADTDPFVCFLRGTEITTIMGAKKIEELQAGDLLLTRDMGYQPIRWIGSSIVPPEKVSSNIKLKPIRIKAGAMGAGRPVKDLLVSRQHRMLLNSPAIRDMIGTEEALVPAIKLTVMPGIDIVDDIAEVEYFHMLFDDHQVIYANGAEAESLYLGPQALNSVSAEALEEIQLLFPEILAEGFTPTAARYIPKTNSEMKKIVELHKAHIQEQVQALA